ncbi:MAG: hypothetical protein ACTSX9_00935 [Candidatus Njordarchaeales archaeon]
MVPNETKTIKESTAVKKYLFMYFILLVTVQLVGALAIVFYVRYIPSRLVKFLAGVLIATFIGFIWPIILAIIIQKMLASGKAEKG